MLRYRVFFVLVVLLYAGALFAPARQIKSKSHYEREEVTHLPGWRVAELGWIGPLGLTFGWYANFPLFVGMSRMARGRSPGRGLSRFGGLLALSSLLPFAVYSEVDGWHRGYVRGLAVWLWLGAFAVAAGAAEMGRRIDEANSFRQCQP